MSVSSPRRVLKNSLAILAGLLGFMVLSGAVVVSFNWAAFGKRAQGDRLARMERSPQWDDGGFENPQPLSGEIAIAKIADALLNGSDYASPEHPEQDIPVIRGDGSEFKRPPATGLTCDLVRALVDSDRDRW